MFPITSAAALRARQRNLGQELGDTIAVLGAGLPQARNYAANQFPFRASSHFLYLVGQPLEGAFVWIEGDRSVLFTEEPDRDDAIWHGERKSFAALAEETGVSEVAPLSELAAHVARARDRVATLPPQDATTATRVSELLARPIAAHGGPTLVLERDVLLAEAMIGARLCHDLAAQDQLRAAARASAAAHVAGMRVTKKSSSEAEVAAEMVCELQRRGMSMAYGPIVTVHGEVLHARGQGGRLGPRDLLLCDVGGESPEGWASDITRTWPVSGTFSATQRALYEVVLSAQERAVDRVRPGVRYREVHETAKRAIVEGLVQERILRGDVDGLLERGAANLFFPHGVGHLLGLDVHDMEDLGDRAGYAAGRARSARFGDRYLRLDRDLAPGMAVTIEPGFYVIPGILADESLCGPLGADLDRDRLAIYADVRGIRIEDDVLCTEGDPEVLSAAAPKRIPQIEGLMRG